MNRDPLIVDFQTESGNYYVYDVGTNQTYPVDKLDIDIVKNYRKMSLDELKASLKSYSKDQIEKSYRKVSMWIEKGGAFFPDWSESNIAEIPSKQKYFRDLANLDLLTLELTQNCNLRCRYCIYSDNLDYIRNHCNKRMSWEVAKRSIDYFIGIINSPWRTSTADACIGFYGGEPLLEFELIKECVEYCKQQDSKVQIKHNMTTNGTLLTEEIAKFLVDNEIALLISLDGPQSEHDKHRVFKSNRGSFSKVDANLELILKIDKQYYENHVHFNTVYSPLTDLGQVVSYFAQSTPKFDQRINKIQLMAPQELKFYNSISLCRKKASMTQVETYFKKYEEIEKRGEKNEPLFWPLRHWFGEPYFKFKKRRYMLPEYVRFKAASCIPGHKRLFVDTDGRFHTCERIAHCFPIGDCWNGIKYKAVKMHFEYFLNSICIECHRCIAANNCNNCMASTSRNGYFDKIDCKKVRTLFKRSLVEYYSILEKNQDAFEN